MTRAACDVIYRRLGVQLADPSIQAEPLERWIDGSAPAAVGRAQHLRNGAEDICRYLVSRNQTLCRHHRVPLAGNANQPRAE